MFELLKQMGEPLRCFDGRKVDLVTFQLYIPKTDAYIQFYDDYGKKSDVMVTPFRWTLNWKNAPMDQKLFSMYVKDVYDVPEIPYYNVTILVTDKLVISDFKDYFFTGNTINWEELCLPWKKFTHYSYIPAK